MRTLMDEDKDKTEEKHSDSSNSSDFSKLHLKAPKLDDKHKGKLFDQLLGFPVNSQLDLKLVQGVFGKRAERVEEGNRQLLQRSIAENRSGINFDSSM